MAKRINKNKIPLDKYYTPDDTALYCINKTKEIIGQANITCWLEPSAGAGAFCKFLPEGYEAYDIKPEDNGLYNIEQADYLKLFRPYKQGTCIIGNPPFGEGGDKLLKDFYNVACGMGDYIAWILPVGYLDNHQTLYQFDLIHSEDLGILNYSGRPIHCCFNIYTRPVGLGENKLIKTILNDVRFTRIARCDGDHNKHQMSDFDIVICSWGSTGSVATTLDQFAQSVGITILNPDLRDDILRVIKETDWRAEFPAVSVPILSPWKLIRILKREIPTIK